MSNKHLFTFDPTQLPDQVTQVELVTSARGWKPMAMTLNSATGVFELELPLDHGEHQYQFRVNAAKWCSDLQKPRILNQQYGHHVNVVYHGGATDLPYETTTRFVRECERGSDHAFVERTLQDHRITKDLFARGLYSAVEHNHLTMIRTLVSHAPNRNFVMHIANGSSLHAIHFGKITPDALDSLLGAGVSPNLPVFDHKSPYYQSTPLHIYAKSFAEQIKSSVSESLIDKYCRIVKMLIQAGCNRAIRDGHSRTASEVWKLSVSNPHTVNECQLFTELLTPSAEEEQAAPIRCKNCGQYFNYAQNALTFSPCCYHTGEIITSTEQRESYDSKSGTSYYTVSVYKWNCCNKTFSGTGDRIPRGVQGCTMAALHEPMRK